MGCHRIDFECGTCPVRGGRDTCCANHGRRDRLLAALIQPYGGEVMWVRSLSTLDCSKILARSHFGHLGCSKDGRPYVVPFYFCYSDSRLYAFSMPGKKIDFMRANPCVCVLVDERGSGREWRSVLVDGRFEELKGDTPQNKIDQEHAWNLLSKHVNWWEPGGLKPDQRPIAQHSSHLFFRICVEQVSGREAVEGEQS
ncbi:pyridoxamine 5'-phosphate oxidase family protein [Aminobacter ciceronei]